MGGILNSLGQVLDSSLAQGSAGALVIAFIFGVFVGFTPCIYPVLPLTIAYIGSIARTRGSAFLYSLVYVLGMAIVYTVIGVITALAGGQIGQMWSNGWVLLVLANFFLVLALWQLDVIRISFPQFVKGPTDRRGGILGALGVGAASGLIVGPCTLPGLAAMITLIAASAREGAAGGVLFGAATMLAYSFGMGSLIILSGTFSGFLSTLPRSGRWLNAIKITFAVLLFLVAEFFLIYLGQNANFPDLGALLARSWR